MVILRGPKSGLSKNFEPGKMMLLVWLFLLNPLCALSSSWYANQLPNAAGNVVIESDYTFLQSSPTKLYSSDQFVLNQLYPYAGTLSDLIVDPFDSSYLYLYRTYLSSLDSQKNDYSNCILNCTSRTIVQLIKLETLSFTIVWSKILYDITAGNTFNYPVIDLTIYGNDNSYQLMANTYPTLFAINPTNGNINWQITHKYNDSIPGCQSGWYWQTTRIFYMENKLFRPYVVMKYPYWSGWGPLSSKGCPAYYYSINEFRLEIYSTLNGNLLMNESLINNVINVSIINFVAMSIESAIYYLYGVNPINNRLSCWNISLSQNEGHNVNLLWDNTEIYSD